MANVSHASLTGSSLHEPKGVADAAANSVYAANGSGSGTWTDVNTLLTTTNFTTGDCKLTWKTTADSGWVMMNDGTIGDALSSGSTRANADCEDLFTLLWTNISNTYAAVSSGRGASAAADWAAHKTIALPKALGRSFLMAGNPSGLTTHSLGQTGGAETAALAITNIPAHTHTATTSTNGSHNHEFSGTTGVNSVSHTHNYDTRSSLTPTSFGGDFSSWTGTSTVTTGAQSSDHTHSYSGNTNMHDGHNHTLTTSSVGSGTAFSTVDPYTAINIMVKL